MKTRMIALALPLALAAFCALVDTDAAVAQGDPYLEMVRTDVAANKIAIMTEAMMLTTAEGDVFWPIYREFQSELSKLGDARIQNTKLFAANFETLTDDQAKEIAKNWFDNENKYMKLLKNTHKKIAKEINPGVAARFVQVENLLQNYIDITISAEMPLFPKTEPAAE